MKKIITYMLICVMLISMLILMSCNNEISSADDSNGETTNTDTNVGTEGDSNTNMDSDTVSNTNTDETKPVEQSADIRSTILSVSEETATAVVSNATTTFSFLNDVKVEKGATYILANDIGCQDTIVSKTVSLNEGDNTYYILVTNENVQKLYTVTIRRRPIYTIEFNTNGGTSVETLYVEEDSTIEMQQTSKVGYTLDGWTIDGKQIEFPYQVKKSESVVARWQACENKLVLDGNGATSGSMVDMAIDTDETVSLENNKFEKLGYTFKGWSTTENGSVAYTDGARYTMGANSTYKLYAVWEKVNYRIIYNLDGGTNGNNLGSYTIEQEITLESPQKAGYTFEGWYDNSTFDGDSIIKIEKGSIGDKQFYARWKACENKLIFDGNGATNGSMTDMTIKTDETVSLENNKFERVGYTFKGWSTTENGSVEFVDGASYTMEKNSTYTLYAVWTPINYSITYNLNSLGKNNSKNPQSYNVEKAIALIEPTSDYEYYDFVGWYTDSEFTNKIEKIENCTGDIALYARWETNSKALTFIKIGDSYSVTACVDGILNVIIPSMFNGCPVTSIGNHAFKNRTSIASITIPDSITSIENSTFAGCNLPSVNYLGTIEQWCNISFGDYTANPLYNGAKLYINGTLLTNLVISNTITKIKDYAFYGFTSLTSVIIENGVTTIGKNAFDRCTSLTNVTIGNSVTTIGEYAFEYCTSLTSVTIPNSITSIGNCAFIYCTSLASVNYLGTIEQWCNISFDYSANPLFYAKKLYINNELVTSLVIPDTVTEIKAYAFSRYKGLTSIEIPNSVTSIGNYAFQNCTSLTSITIPDSVTSIGNYAFDGCTSLTSVTIPNSVTTIGNYAFFSCTSLTSVTIGNSVAIIGESAFSYCTSLTSITIPNSVAEIGMYAFTGCTLLTIYCEAARKPSAWWYGWNSSNCPVEWGYTGE